MAKIMEIIAKETKGKSYHTYKYSYDSIGLPSIDYDDDPNKIMKWKDSAETGSPKRPIDLKPLADQLQEIGEPPLLKYFLDGSRHVFKVDDIAYAILGIETVSMSRLDGWENEICHTLKEKQILSQASKDFIKSPSYGDGGMAAAVRIVSKYQL